MLERIAAGRTDLIFDWIAGGGDPGASVEGAELIGWCAYYGDVSAMRRLVEAGVPFDRLGRNLGLGGAAFHGHWQLCAWLIEQGADPCHADPESGETALHNAVSRRDSPGMEAVVAVLLAAGADPNRKTVAGTETGCFMRDVRNRGEGALHRAAAYAAQRTIERLIAAGAVLDQRDAQGDSPLSWASWALRDTAILCLLAFPPHRVNPERTSMAAYLVGDADRAIGKPN
ncbi:ankyrin repeat domain-containing protein [Sphingomonas koreensis]